MPALLFDLDGTLIDSRHDIAAAANAGLCATGRQPLPVEVVVGYIGDGFSQLLERLCQSDDERVLEPARAAFRAHYSARLLDQTRLYPGIIAALDAFAAEGWRLAVVTNKPEAWSRMILDGLGLSDRFVCLIGGDGPRKPAPDQLHQALAACGCSAGDSWMIGDHHTDIRAGRAAGTRVAYCAWGIGNEDGLVSDLRVDRAEELVAGISPG